jgi:hypothetical protein
LASGTPSEAAAEFETPAEEVSERSRMKDMYGTYCKFEKIDAIQCLTSAKQVMDITAARHTAVEFRRRKPRVGSA